MLLLFLYIWRNTMFVPCLIMYIGGLTVWSEPKEPCFHFLVFTDVFGNQTHGVVLQYCRPVQVC